MARSSRMAKREIADAGEQYMSGQVEIVTTAVEHFEGYHTALDTVAKERKFLTMREAFPLQETRKFLLNMISQGNPHVVATVGDTVVGWCDISRHFFPAHAHRGTLAMGIIPGYRGLGIGYRLVLAALEKAREVELSASSYQFTRITDRRLASTRKLASLGKACSDVAC